MKAFGSRRAQRYVAPDDGGIITDGLVGWWPFNEGPGNSTTADESGNGRTGVLVGDPTWVSGTPDGYALDFNGSSQYVDVTNPVEVSAALTIMCWVDTNKAWGSSYIASPNFINKENTNPGTYALFVNDANSKAVFQLRLSGSVSTARQIFSNSVLSVDRVHLSGTYDGSTMYFYIDGVLQTNTVSATDSVDTNAPGVLRIGLHPTYVGQDRGIDGTIDDVRVYNRALTQEEINSIVAGTG